MQTSLSYVLICATRNETSNMDVRGWGYSSWTRYTEMRSQLTTCLDFISLVKGIEYNQSEYYWIALFFFEKFPYLHFCACITSCRLFKCEYFSSYSAAQLGHLASDQQMGMLQLFGSSDHGYQIG